MNSNSSSRKRKVLSPTRDVGRQRVAELMQAAAEVIDERGYESATMAEIAERADARIGSLYRFFPSKKAVGDALADGYSAILAAAFATLVEQAPHLSPGELADRLIDLLVALYPKTRAIRELLNSRTDWTRVRLQCRAEALEGIGAVLEACSHDVAPKLVADIAVVVLNNMKTMLGMMKGDAPTSPGALAEVKLMNRLYLTARLSAEESSSHPCRMATSATNAAPLLTRRQRTAAAGRR